MNLQSSKNASISNHSPPLTGLAPLSWSFLEFFMFTNYLHTRAGICGYLYIELTIGMLLALRDEVIFNRLIHSKVLAPWDHFFQTGRQIAVHSQITAFNSPPRAIPPRSWQMTLETMIVSPQKPATARRGSS